MKYVLFLLMTVVTIVTGCAVFGRVLQENTPGDEFQWSDVYEGSAIGYRGSISVQVRMRSGSIMDITIMDSTEDRFVGESAMEELIDIVIENNSTDVDVISGATITSKGFLSAVDNAIMGHE